MRALPLCLALAGLLAPPALAHVEGDDCGSGGDAPSAVQEGALIGAPVDCTAHFGGAEDGRDSYLFLASPGQHIEVEVVPKVGGHAARLGLFAPDHDGDGFSTRVDDKFGIVTAQATEPGLWGFYVYLYTGSTVTTLAHADYRIIVRVSGESWPVDATEGAALVGTSMGSVANAALGPSAADGIDGDWIDLAATTTSGDFVRAATTDCAGCLTVRFRLADGTIAAALAYQTNGGMVACHPPAGATHALVATTNTMGAAFELRHWHPA